MLCNFNYAIIGHFYFLINLISSLWFKIFIICTKHTWCFTFEIIALISNFSFLWCLLSFIGLSLLKYNFFWIYFVNLICDQIINSYLIYFFNVFFSSKLLCSYRNSFSYWAIIKIIHNKFWNFIFCSMLPNSIIIMQKIK